eukprot:CAMPEP_0196130164 /NCGR_PEP_ID=MMETSP0910-20130528/630_1 /TAXON_ID=49265 /ORGANISM="Thalassiosira rotula, Strain GSO102" /LENGTH=583 /DNA_ID=CAMNT_0041389415 /DNA_START=153 /DNA_END=1901 /DNA_ORIENTATION=-
MKKPTTNGGIMLMADTFPSKAYLLLTHLSQNDPKVSSFSSDGLSFEIYDQSVFASKYLPQYFKHSNYGSFVRQLNLYGFTSSRLKQNIDVVVWTHELFQRDRKELLKDIKIKRKKPKATNTSNNKPSQVVHVQNNPRSPSPPSLSDEASSSDNNNYTTNNNANTALKVVVSRKGSVGSSSSTSGGGGSSSVVSLEQSWLESEFTILKQQNKFLEDKLDAQSVILESKLELMLKEIAMLRIMESSSSESPRNRMHHDGGARPPRTENSVEMRYYHHQEQAGGKQQQQQYRQYLHQQHQQHQQAGGIKRRRMSPIESGNRDDDYEVGAAAAAPRGAPRHLLSVSEEQKLFDEDEDDDDGRYDDNGHHHNDGIYGDQKMNYYDDNQNNDKGEQECDNYGIEPAPYPPYYYEGGRKMPPNGTNSNNTAHPRDDSLKRFVDIMLSEEEQEECTRDGNNINNNTANDNNDNNNNNNNNSNTANNNYNNDTVAQLPERMSEDMTDIDDALMREAMNAILPDDDDDAVVANAYADTDDVGDAYPSTASGRHDGREIDDEVMPLPAMNNVEKSNVPTSSDVVTVHAIAPDDV